MLYGVSNIGEQYVGESIWILGPFTPCVFEMNKFFCEM